MKPTNFAPVTSLIQILIPLVIISLHVVSASKYGIEEFISCLPHHSNASNPITKAIYTPNDTPFSSVLQAYIRNLRFNTSTTPKPLAIVTALDKSHVQATVKCAKANGLEVRIRSGGHDFEGLSYVSHNPFIILDLFKLRSIDIDLASETAWVQSGATLGELIYNIANKSNSHAFPAGVCYTVGVGGHFSGGGYGNLIRKFGLTVDNVIDAEIVDANGRILNRKTMGEDLFWAIRGGGAASFCVVLRWKINLVRVPETVATFLVHKTIGNDKHANDIFHRWQSVAPNLDPDLFIRVQANLIQNNGTNTVQLLFIGLYLGRADDLVQLMNRRFPQLGLKKHDCSEQSWVESSLVFSYLPLNSSLEILLDRVPATPLTYDKHKSDYVEKPIPKVGLKALWKKMIELETIFLQFNPYGGKMSQIPEDATPFPHRKGILFKIQYLSDWKEDSPKITDQHLQAMRDLYNLMTPYVSTNPRQAFLNYRDIDIGTNANKSTGFGLDYFKGNLKRLLMVKAKVDPSDFFKNEQSIPLMLS